MIIVREDSEVVLIYPDIYLVGGFNHLAKYEFVNGKDDIPYMMVKKEA